MNSTHILFITAALTISACGFDSRKSDPMRGANSSGYISSSEKVLEQQKLEKKFLEETKVYKESVAQIQQSAESNKKSMEEKYQNLIRDVRAQAQQSQNQCEAEKGQFVQDLNSYKSQQDKVIADMKTLLQGWEQQANSCQNLLENPEKQNFHGLLFRRDMESALPKAIEFSVQEPISHKIYFKLDLAHSSVVDLQVEPTLPQGLNIDRKSDDTWIIGGTPQVQFKNNQSQLRSIHTVMPVIDFSKITDETTRTLIEQQNFEEKIMIVIYPGQPPVVEGVLPSLEGENQ